MIEMSYTRATRRKNEIANAKKRTELRYQMAIAPFETEDGIKDQTKLFGAVRRESQRWDK